MHALQGKQVDQVALVVSDIHRAAAQWASALGQPVPEIMETEDGDVTGTLYRGQPTTARAKLAFLNLGNCSLELIEPMGGPSVWRDYLDRCGDGVQHLAHVVDDIEQILPGLAAMGCEEIQRGNFKGGRYCYVDTAAVLGVVIELLDKRQWKRDAG